MAKSLGGIPRGAVVALTSHSDRGRLSARRIRSNPMSVFVGKKFLVPFSLADQEEPLPGVSGNVSIHPATPHVSTRLFAGFPAANRAGRGAGLIFGRM